MGSGQLRVFLHDYGGYAFTAQLGRALAGRGHQVLYSHSLSSQLMQRFTTQPAKGNFTIEGVRLQKPFARYNFPLRWRDEREHGRLVAEQVRAFHPDLVLSANTPLDAQALIQRASRRVGAGFLFWMQDFIGLATKNALTPRLLLLGNLIGEHYLGLEKRLAKASDAIVVISEYFLNYLAGWGVDPARLHVIPNWAPLEEIPLLPKSNPWAHAHSLVDKFVFLFTGVLGLKHDATLFLTLADSFRKYPEVRVVVVAEGPFTEKLRAEGKARNLDNLITLPYQPAAAYPQMLASAEVLMTILKSDASVYSVPSKVYAYMCASRPQLLSISARNPAAALVTTHRMGLVSDPGDLDAWLANAHALHQNRYNNNQMGKNARVYAEANFDIDRITDIFELLMRQALKRD